MKNNRVYHSKSKESNDYGKYLEGKDVKRYGINWGGLWLKYGECLAAPRDEKLFTSPRILVRQIPSPPPHSINAVFTKEYLLNDINSMIIYDFNGIDPLFTLAVLNSKITTFWFVNTFDKFQRKIFPQFKVKELAIFPIPSASPAEQEKIAKKAQTMLDLNKELQATSANTDKHNSLKREIEKLDQEVDKQIYKLYNLNEKKLELLKIVTSKKFTISDLNDLYKLLDKAKICQFVCDVFSNFENRLTTIENQVAKNDVFLSALGILNSFDHYAQFYKGVVPNKDEK